LNYEVRALVVDGSGVRELPLDPVRQDAPTFEMTQTEYTNALNSSLWNSLVSSRFPNMDAGTQSTLQAQLDAWRDKPTTGTSADNITQRFAPAAMLRLDAGTASTADDPRNVRYLISQMNSVASPFPNSWINVNGVYQAVRRIHLFEVRWIDPANTPYLGYQRAGWGIVDTNGNYTVYPDPLAPEFPNLPGWTYALTQPLSIDKDQ
jgi:hypothetical protein